MKKILRILDIITHTIEWMICIALVLLIVVSISQRVSNSNSFFGYRIYVVASNSMIPIYTIGDTLLIKDSDPREIKVGDALTYMGEEGDMAGMIITHQVQEIEESDDGSFLFHTKGVANSVEDPIVSERQVFGKVIYCFFLLSILGKITSNMILLFVFVTIPLAILLGIEMFKIFGKDFYKDVDLVEDEDNDDEIEVKEIDIEKENLEAKNNNKKKKDKVKEKK